MYTGFQSNGSATYLSLRSFCLGGCFIFFLCWCLSPCHLFFVFLEYQRSWNGLMIATMSNFIFCKWASLTLLTCGCMSAVVIRGLLGRLQQGRVECISASSEPESQVLDPNTPKNRGGSLDWKTQLSFCTLFHLQSAWACGLGYRAAARVDSCTKGVLKKLPAFTNQTLLILHLHC